MVSIEESRRTQGGHVRAPKMTTRWVLPTKDFISILGRIAHEIAEAVAPSTGLGRRRREKEDGDRKQDRAHPERLAVGLPLGPGGAARSGRHVGVLK